jgi:hypothetical protein
MPPRKKLARGGPPRTKRSRIFTVLESVSMLLKKAKSQKKGQS